jgi:signal transduction histidine kinase
MGGGSRASEPRRIGDPLGGASLRRLKIIGVVPPVIFTILIEIVRFTTVEVDLNDEANNEFETIGHLVLAGALMAAVFGFAAMMFHFIGKAQRDVVWQNRQLSLVTAVSTAVRDDAPADEIVDHALASMLASDGVLSASIMLARGEAVHTRRATGPGASGHRGTSGTPPQDCSAIDIALTAGTSAVGTMRLEVPVGTEASDFLAVETMQTIGRQVGYAVQRALLIGDLQRGKAEGHAFYEVLLEISAQRSLPRTLHAITRIARDRLGADEAVLYLDEAASRVVRVDTGADGRALDGDGLVCVTPDRLELSPDRGKARARGRLDAAPETTSNTPAELPSGLTVPLGAPGAGYGDLWVGRRSGEPFDERDLRFLATLAELTTIAMNSSRMLESERQTAIVAERERIARELHDSLAQVLGVTHLRLQALRRRASARLSDDVVAELSELAELCHEGYADVREAILGLGQGSSRDRYLLDSLRAYLEAFSRGCGIQARLESGVEADLALVPRCEVQLVRIVQEALTNVRKHSGARHAVVRITRPAASGVEFAVEDDGHGFDPGAVPAGRDGYGFGLFSMSERVRLLGGDLTIDSAPGSGTTLRVRVPASLVQRLSSASASASDGTDGGA